MGFFNPVYAIGFVIRVKKVKKKPDFIQISYRDESAVVCPEIIGMGRNRMLLNNPGSME